MFRPLNACRRLQEEVQAALQKVRRDIEVTCETLLEEQMKLRGKVLAACYR